MSLLVQNKERSSMVNGCYEYTIDQGWYDQEFINENVNFFEDFKESLEEYTLEYAEEVTGISKETLIQMAEMIRDADGTCILWGMG